MTPPLHCTFPLITDQRPSKRACKDGENFAPPEDVVSFWRDLWVERKSPFHEQVVPRYDDAVEDVEVPSTMTVIRGLPGSFYAGTVMKRHEYDLALKDLIEMHEDPILNAVVIVGHPGIGRMSISHLALQGLIEYPGKTCFLFYVLVHRLLAQQPTIFQFDPHSIYLFFQGGVRLLPHHRLHPIVDVKHTWALLDTKRRNEIAAMFLREPDPVFLVIASSPQPSHWADAEHYMPPIRKWFMEPFSLQELIQALVFQSNHLVRVLTGCCSSHLQSPTE